MGDAQLRLIVMRHAKAGELPGRPDAERALTGRGRRDAAAAGRWLRESGLVPDAVICSAAVRTRQTWEEVAARLGREVDASMDGRLYDAGVPEVLEVAAETSPDVATLLCVGHNPAMARLAADLTGSQLEFPTSAIAVVSLPGPWDALLGAAGPEVPGDLLAYWTPRHR